MWRRRSSQSEPSLPASNPAYAYPYSNAQSSSQIPRGGPIEGPSGHRLTRRVTWRSSTYKLVAYLYVLGVLYIVWLIRDMFYLPFSSYFFSAPVGVNHPPATIDHLALFHGRQECGISSLSFYNSPSASDGQELRDVYCQNRSTLLDAFSNGGRPGFDAPFTPRGCQYQWYAAEEICSILHRFDHVIFLGDSTLANIYAAFNILLRQDLAHGSLKQWELSSIQLEACKCENQFSRESCWVHRLHLSDEVYSTDGDAANRNSYACPARISHRFLTVEGSPASSSARETVVRLLLKASNSNKPIPVIHSLTFSTAFSLQTAIESMDEWLQLAKVSEQNVPFLWVGPTAAGDANLAVPGNSAAWHHTLETIEAAQQRGIDAVGMYNATLRATSWDSVHYGEKTSLMQAMMLINWLARIET